MRHVGGRNSGTGFILQVSIPDVYNCFTAIVYFIETYDEYSKSALLTFDT